MMKVDTTGRSLLSLDQGLETLAHEFGDQLTGSAAAMQLHQLGGDRISDGHGLVLRLKVESNQGLRPAHPGAPIAPQGI